MTKRKEKNKGNPLQRQNPKVEEVTRIRISQILEQFRASKDEVYKFEAGLSNEDRALVHQLAQKMGFKSKSSGYGKERRVAVHKIKKKVETNNGFGNLPCFAFSQEASQVLGNLFAHYPPGDGSLWEMIGEDSGSTEKFKPKKDDIFARPSMSKADIAKKMEALNSRIMTTSNLKQITEDRSKLPIASFKDTIVTTIESHQVVLISGETGCGKTTQVPQFILDHMWSKGEVCKIVCTQPRRISATSVSDRIASERGEGIGESVGYKIRLEGKGGRNSSIVLCTTGVLLRVLVSKSSCSSKTGPIKDDISGITHIIMDEIHERDRYSDFMLAIIRDMLPSYPRLRLVLMSATIDAARFSQYFGGCPIINVPGFTYPVKTFYLEDVLSIIKSNDGGNHLEDNTTSETPINNCELSEEEKLSIDEAINLACFNDEWEMLSEMVSSEGSLKLFNYQHSLTGLTPLMVFAGKGRVGDMCMLLSLGADCHLRSHDGNIALEIAERENQQEAAEILKKHMDNNFSNSIEEKQLLDKYLATVNPELIDEVLIEQLIRKICVDSEDGGILVFLPGWDDINRTRERLLASSFFKNQSKFMVIALHSMVPSMEQRKVFKRPPHGCRKIVLSTNIAETAITIDDIVYVIDTGRMKEKSYDPYNNVSTLQSSWVSKASAKQREGRAGRCQPGICYHLYSKIRAASLPDFQIPEIRRISIEELCLQVKLLDPTCKIEEYLSKTLDPPVLESIRHAILVLQDIGALSTDEKLTQLGEKLGSLPVHPLTSRMLFFAILMDCLNPALTVACASDYRNPFTLPMLPEERKRASAAKAELASLYGGSGDQFAVVAAFECWSNAKNMGLESRFCSQYFVSSSAMHMLSGMRKQLQKELVRSGFVPEDSTSYSMNAHDPGVLHAVLVAGLYPMVGRFSPNKKGKRAIIETAGGDKVRLHNHSINFKLSLKKNAEHTLIVYDEITRGDMGMSIRNCTVVGPLPLLLLSTEIAVAPAQDNDNGDGGDGSDYDNDDDNDEESEDEDEVKLEDAMEVDNKSSGDREDKIMSSPENMVKVIMDRWLYFGSTAMDVAQLYCLRERLSAAILYKVTHPRNSLPPMLGASMQAIACILSCDGCSGLPVTSDGVDTLATMVNTTYLGKPAPGTRRLGKKQKGQSTEHINSEGSQIPGPSKGSISAS
ncbi:DExH-box ATP-dependent RNA helicase DExH6 isoform X1 [Arachis duranensis]|uniref:DExH-box ATP-dependent RNA helicase DExH6 isoform X1 n=1 Tax=Arachis duranensis TaxID=130453 RepID=A0A6P4DZI4_ARADU|nr:DExH-box ATP-dependent RNA helicase DExH6 isoform X1 [Arachis duranensis]